ncbi:MAG: hypothetical protein JSU63_14965 [Phycisphaerales bacterium]|nr:MAG: hypothetical protein JSU63_14965 [Phycisphaerales bacterium]
MKGATLADFLTRAVLDETFRELAITDPRRAFDGYNLSEQEKEILTKRDSRLPGLLGDAMAQSEPAVEQSPKSAHVEKGISPVPSLPEVKLLLHLAPQLVEQSESGPQVAYTASLQPWPGDDEPKRDLDTPEQAQCDDRTAGHELTWVIRMTPVVVGTSETQLEVSYSVSIDRLTSDPSHTSTPECKPERDIAGAPWNHHVDSDAARAAARSVRATDPKQRYAKLLELVHALQTGDIGG